MNRKKSGIHATPTLKLPMLCWSYQIIFQTLRENSLVAQQKRETVAGGGDNLFLHLILFLTINRNAMGKILNSIFTKPYRMATPKQRKLWQYHVSVEFFITYMVAMTALFSDDQ